MAFISHLTQKSVIFYTHVRASLRYTAGIIPHQHCVPFSNYWNYPFVSISHSPNLVETHGRVRYSVPTRLSYIRQHRVLPIFLESSKLFLCSFILLLYRKNYYYSISSLSALAHSGRQTRISNNIFNLCSIS